MSTNVKKFIPTITERLDYATVDVYLLTYEVLTISEYDSYRKALQNGTLTNGDVVRTILPKILMKPRKFYQALRTHVEDNSNLHSGNNELFHMLPENFVSVAIYVCILNTVLCM